MNSATLDIENFNQLRDYLRETGRIGGNETPKFLKLDGGVSNRTVWAQREDGQAWVLKQALAKLRVQVDWHSDPRRIEREALGMRRLGQLAPAGAITKLIFLDPAFHLLAMQAVPHPHENWKTMLLGGRVNAAHVEQFGRLLGAIHRGGWENRDAFSGEFSDRDFFESLRLEPYYLYAAGQIPAAADFLHALVAVTRRTSQTLVHGDYSPKNVLVHDGRLVLLDHEVIHFGDGAFDVGFALTHFLSKAHYLQEPLQTTIPNLADSAIQTAAAARGQLPPDAGVEHGSGPPRAISQIFADAGIQFWEAYRDALGDVPWAGGLEQRAVSHTLACLLARCRGRSPLEYLDGPARSRQANAVVRMMAKPPSTISSLTRQFLGGVQSR